MGKITLGQFLEPLKDTAEGSIWIEDVELRFRSSWAQARELELNDEILARFTLLIIDAIRTDVHRACTEERYKLYIEDGLELLEAISKRAQEHGLNLPPELIRPPLSYAEDIEQAGLVEIVDNQVILPSSDET